MAYFVCSLNDFMKNVEGLDSPATAESLLLGKMDMAMYRNKDGTLEPIEFADQKGGENGLMDAGAPYIDCHTILKIGDKHFKIEYTYFSRSGYDFDEADVYRVEPKQVTATVFV